MKIFTSGARGIAVALVGAGALAAASCGEVQGTPESAPAQVRPLPTNAGVFGHLMAGLSGSVAPEDFVQDLFTQSKTGAAAQVLTTWPKRADGKLDLTKSPLRLRGLVNPVDARDLHFVVAVLEASGTPRPLTVPVQTDRPARTPAAARDWEQRWKALATLTPGTDAYTTGLQALTERLTALPGRVQLSTNEPRAAGPQQTQRPANDLSGPLDEDVVPPTAELTSPAPGSFLRGTVALTANASDDVGVARVDFLDGTTLIGSATQAPYTVNWITTGTSGPRSLTAQAFDAAGNPGTSSAVSVLVDNHVPIILIGPPKYNPSNQNYVRGIVDVGWAVTDQSLSGVAYVEFLQNGAWMGSASGLPDASTYYYSWDTRVLGNRSYTLTLRATDNAGNVQTSARSLIVDNALPWVNLVAPANGTQVSGVVTLTAYASDSQALLYVRFEVDGQMLTPFSTSAPFTKTWDSTGKSGTHEIAAIAVDRAGNSKRSAVTVTVP